MLSSKTCLQLALCWVRLRRYFRNRLLRLQAKLDALWGGFSDVARDPGNSTARVQVLAQANGTDWLNNAATELGDLKPTRVLP